MSERVVTINSFSKTYAMTGWRLGYAVADESTIAKMTKLQMYLDACPMSFGQYAVAKALGDPRSKVSIEAMRSEYESRRNYVYGRLRNMDGMEVSKPGGAFYIFPRVKGRGDVTLSEKLLLEAKVAAVPGSTFGKYGVNHLRLCYATAMKYLEEAMDRMEKFMGKIP
jgi:aminotransferase